MTLHVRARVEKQEILSHGKKIREIRSLVISLVKRYFHEIFAIKV